MDIANVLILAKNACNSKNYSQAEEFCNQILAEDASCAEAWITKATAINYQITAKNQRIEEVVNCLNTAYDMLDDTGKEEHKDNLLNTMRTCITSEVDYRFQLLNSDGLASGAYKNLTFVFKYGTEQINSFMKKLGYASDVTSAEFNGNIDAFIEKVVPRVKEAWTNHVKPNYYRNGFTSSYHPTKEIWRTFYQEVDTLCDLLRYCASMFSDRTPLSTKVRVYDWLVFLEEKAVNSAGYTLMQQTTRNGFGAIVSQREYWEKSAWYGTKDQNESYQRIREYKKLYTDLRWKLAETDPNERKKLREEHEEERRNLDLRNYVTSSGTTLIITGIGAAFLGLVVFIVMLVSVFQNKTVSSSIWLFLVGGVLVSAGGVFLSIYSYKNNRYPSNYQIYLNKEKYDELTRIINKLS